MSIDYAFKQAESSVGGPSPELASTGWETMLSALLSADSLSWDMAHADRIDDQPQEVRRRACLVHCPRLSPRSATAPLATRKEFIGALRAELPDALQKLQHGNIAPVDLAQASIGPGMSVFSRYSRVMEADGTQMSVELHSRSSTRHWTKSLLSRKANSTLIHDGLSHGSNNSVPKRAISASLRPSARPRTVSVRGLVEAGIVEAKTGKVRLLLRDELDEMWDPSTDQRLTVWEMTEHLLRRLDEGETAAAALAHQLGSYAEVRGTWPIVSTWRASGRSGRRRAKPTTASLLPGLK